MEIFYPYSWWKKINLAASSLKVVDHAMGQLARLLGAAIAAAILVVCLGVFLVRWVFFRRPLDIRRE
jgi:hypothetical protein